MIIASKQSALYPLQHRFLVWGVIAGALGVTVCWSFPLVGLSTFALLALVGCLWRHDEPPILVFCIAYQWLFVMTGYAYWGITGSYPSLPKLGNLEGAILLSMFGFIALVAGIRAGFHILRPHFESARKRLDATSSRYDIRRLFWWVVMLYTINWFVGIASKEMLFSAAQIIDNILSFRSVFLLLLLLAVLQYRMSYGYAVVAFLYVLIPQFASMMSHFKELFFLLVIALFREWRPWSASVSEQLRSIRIGWAVAAIAVSLLLMASFWEGGIKPRWRSAIMSGAVVGSPVAKINAFMSTARVAAREFEARVAVKKLAARMSSGVGYFSHVLQRVPRVVPHEGGGLTLRALRHIVRPRILFPEKQNLGGDSWLIWQYAGIRVAGEEQKTSVGLGYMAQFYIDFGVPGMFVPLFMYGLLIGLAYQAVLFFAPSHLFFSSTVTVLCLQHFTSYEGEIAKLIGGFAQMFLIFIVFLYVIGPWLHRQMRIDKRAA